MFWVRFEHGLFPETNKQSLRSIKRLLSVRFEPATSLVLTFAIAKSSSSSCSLTFRISSGLGLLISDLKNMKAPGWDEISNEHLKYAGVLTKSAITFMLNKIVENECIPKNLKRGFMISLPKPQKDATLKTNNRGITLLPVLYKMFEKTVLLK